MTAPLKPWNTNGEAQVLRSSNPNPVIPQIGGSRSIPLLPPRPAGNTSMAVNSYGLQTPYSSYGYGGGYGSLGYRSPMYSSYGYGGSSYGYGSNLGMYGMDNYSNFGPRDDTERRFIQYAEESSRNTFANVESVVRAVNSISMMLDNTFFAMTSSFRAVLSVAENFGRLRNMFGHIWYSLNIFRLFRWLYRRLMRLMGYKVIDSAASVAWKEAYKGAGAADAAGGSGGRNWPTIAFFGVLITAPYFISKFLLPKYEDKHNPEKWKSQGIRAKAAFDFVATAPNELSLRVNDEILLAPTYIQEEMRMTNTGWAFAICNGKSGLIPLNYVVLAKRVNSGGVLKNAHNYNYNNNNNTVEELPIPNSRIYPKNNVKRVSFGENQIIESNGVERIVKIPDTDSTNTCNEKKSANTQVDNSDSQYLQNAKHVTGVKIINKDEQQAGVSKTMTENSLSGTESIKTD